MNDSSAHIQTLFKTVTIFLHLSEPLWTMMQDTELLCIICGTRSIDHGKHEQDMPTQRHINQFRELIPKNIMAYEIEALQETEVVQNVHGLLDHLCGSGIGLTGGEQDTSTLDHPKSPIILDAGALSSSELRHGVGDVVKIRRCTNYVGNGVYNGVVVSASGNDAAERTGNTYRILDISDRPIDCSNGNTLVHLCCWSYLQAWLVLSDYLVPAKFPKNKDMSLEGQFYEIVNTRRKPKDVDGTLPAVRYEFIRPVRGGWWDKYEQPHRDVRHISEAMSNGVRGKDLVASFVEDFGYLFTRPDIWPTRPGPSFNEDSRSLTPTPNDTNLWVSQLPTELLITILQFIPALGTISNLAQTCRTFKFRILDDPALLARVLKDHEPPFVGPTRNDGNIFNTLPAEAFMLIMQHLPVYAVTGLASTCRIMRFRIHYNQRFLNEAYRRSILNGYYSWLQPVVIPSFYDESERAIMAARTWLPQSEEVLESSFTLIISSPAFPCAEFVRACVTSPSIRNRKRILGIVKQFDTLWWSYGMSGSQRMPRWV
ncbi:hypothetical protein D9758_010041 [Tetrapyrgos nigripes]|uniref:F-box domain-containing protein n=1 Tax=Tetrapyrgos nigripes TaxID=182062 RepID=A0A8H5FT41_9AGAR|nr:hypothetical protein D9758_010041 [Tetrapyrgos nigripes]